MYQTLCDEIPRDVEYPERVHTLECRERVRDGKVYQGLPYGFHEEKSQGGEYIPLRQRRPSVRYNLCRQVIGDAVSLLFSEGHFPTIRCNDTATREVLRDFIKDRKFNALMVDAAVKGSVGSVAIRVRVIKARVFFDAMSTKYLTPEWDADNPEALLSVTERYKTKGRALRDLGYEISDADLETTHWWKRVWTRESEEWYLPITRTDVRDGKPQVIDDSRTVHHALGFCPIVWIRNLPGGDTTDGMCTFPDEAVDTQIELEYQLSQVGRGLKYSSDPTLLIKEPAIAADGEIVKGAGNALSVSKDGDAKLLEINGSAADVVMKYVKQLREYALETLHGRSADPAKLSAARSAKAMELLNQPLIWLADQLRVSYGEGGLLDLIRMVVKLSQQMELRFGADDQKLSKLSTERVSLHWPPWYPPTPDERQTNANAMTTLSDANLLSKETSTEVLAPDYDVEDVTEELKRIEMDRQRLAKEQATVQQTISA